MWIIRSPGEENTTFCGTHCCRQICHIVRARNVREQFEHVGGEEIGYVLPEPLFKLLSKLVPPRTQIHVWGLDLRRVDDGFEPHRHFVEKVGQLEEAREVGAQNVGDGLQLGSEVVDAASQALHEGGKALGHCFALHVRDARQQRLRAHAARVECFEERVGCEEVLLDLTRVPIVHAVG